MNVVEFDEVVRDALDSLPPELSRFMSNVQIVVEEEPQFGMPLPGPLPGRASHARCASTPARCPTRSRSLSGPLERLYGTDRERLQREIRRVVLHEVAHHSGISDERLVELDDSGVASR